MEKKNEEAVTKQKEESYQSLPIKKLSKKELIEKNGGLGFPTKDKKVTKIRYLVINLERLNPIPWGRGTHKT